MKLTIELTTAEAIALRRFDAANPSVTLGAAAARALREYLVGTGDLEVIPVLDEDSEFQGEA